MRDGRVLQRLVVLPGERERLGEVRVRERAGIDVVRRVGELDCASTGCFGLVEPSLVWRATAPSIKSMKMKLTMSSAPVVARAWSSHSGTSSKRCWLSSTHASIDRERRVVDPIADSLEQVEPVAQDQLGLLEVSPLELELGLGDGHAAQR